MPRLLSLGTALAVAAVSLASVSLPEADAATTVIAKKSVHHHSDHQKHHAKGHHHGKAHKKGHKKAHHQKAPKTLTNYVIAQGSASGTQVNGGMLPVQSGPTGHVVLGCPSTGGGAPHISSTAAVDLAGGAIHLGVTEGKVYSTRSGRYLNAWSTEHIGSITLSLPAIIPGLAQAASLTVDGINTEAHAWQDASGFHAETGGNLADVSVGFAGQTFKLPLPTSALNGTTLNLGATGLLDLVSKIPGLSILTNALKQIPGLNQLTLATISLGKSTLAHNGSSSNAQNDGIVVTVPATKTVVTVGTSNAAVKTVRAAIFRGYGSLIDGTLLNGMVTLGGNVTQYMPCNGTNGKAQTTAVAAVPLNLPTGVPGLNLGVGTDWQQSALNLNTRTAYSHQQVKLADVDLAGQIHISALTSRVNAYRNKGKVVTDTKGSSVGSITIAGQTYTLQQLNGFEIPGVLKIETGVTSRQKVGIDYTALRLTLLGGVGGTINIGHVETRLVRWK